MSPTVRTTLFDVARYVGSWRIFYSKESKEVEDEQEELYEHNEEGLVFLELVPNDKQIFASLGKGFSKMYISISPEVTIGNYQKAQSQIEFYKDIVTKLKEEEPAVHLDFRDT